MMRLAILLLPALALAACDENTGWNPNYRPTEAAQAQPWVRLSRAPSAYQRYRLAREDALTGQGPVPKTIPVRLPAKAPSAADIAGPNLWQIIRRQARIAVPVRAAAPRPGGYVAPVAVAPAAVVTAPTAPQLEAGTAALSRYAAALPGARFARPGADANAALRACRSFESADAAQLAFLAAGGPQIDTYGLDPDGDGIVCGWDAASWRRGAGL